MGIVRTILVAATFLAAASSAVAGTSKFTDLPGSPGLKSASAIVLDNSGNLIYGKDVDTVRPIASSLTTPCVPVSRFRFHA